MPKLWSQTVEAHRHTVRQRILDTTWELAAAHGPLSVTMSRIAEETGVGRATLYRYFPDVESILVAWHERQIAGHLEHLARLASRPRDAHERLRAVLDAYALISHQRGTHAADLATLLHRSDQVGRAQQQLVDLIRELLTETAAEGHTRDDIEPAELAYYCIHALAAAGDLSSTAAVHRLVQVTLDGLRRPI